MMMKRDYGSWRRCGAANASAVAHADDDESVPLTAQQLSSQRTVLGVIAGIVVLAIGFYLFRRWQTIRSGNTIDGGYGKDD